MRRQLFSLLVVLLLSPCIQSISPTSDIQMFPNTENSPSFYLYQFTVQSNIPALSYLLITMSWYTGSLNPYNCIFVNSSITVRCTNFATPGFPLTITTANLLQHNSYMSTSQTVAIELGSPLVANTNYALQIHYYNVIPNIKKISPSIEIYVVSYNGLVYQENLNFGAVLNMPPCTNLFSVSILNILSFTGPGQTTSLRAEIAIAIPVTTSLSAFTFVVQYPFSFSLGSIPLTFESERYATNPIALYSNPQILKFQIISPNVFYMVFNESFVSGRRFIVQISQISNPFYLASSNISFYSLNYNSQTPLEAYEMLYTVATVNYNMSVTLGLPYGAPFLGAMQYYQNTNQVIQLSLVIPKEVPAGYSIRFRLTNANIIYGSADTNLQSLVYTPTYTFVSNSAFYISNFGPLVIGSTVTLTFILGTNGNPYFVVEVFIDKDAVIAAFASSSITAYMYYGSAQGSMIARSSFLNNIYDSTLGDGHRVKYSTSPNGGNWFLIQTYNNIGTATTSAGAYLDVFLPPQVALSTNFNASTDCRFDNSINTCNLIITRTPNYLQLTIRGTTTYLTGTPNPFDYQVVRNIFFYNVYFPQSSSNKYLYPIYQALYKSDIVSPITYYGYLVINVMPPQNTLAGVSYAQYSDFYTTIPASYYTYPGFIRFQSTTPASLNIILQQNEVLTLVFFSYIGFRGFPANTNYGPYPCTSNINVTCNYLIGHLYDYQRVTFWDRIIVTFNDNTYKTTPFHIIIPNPTITSNTYYYRYHLGAYNTLTKTYNFYYQGTQYGRGSMVNSPYNVQSSMAVDLSGKAGSYRQNVSVTVYTVGANTGIPTFLALATQWSFFENGISSLTTGTLAMGNPTFGSLTMSPLSVYMTNGMYLTIIPFTFSSYVSPIKFYLNNVHMPYNYDLPSYYLYTLYASGGTMSSSNQYVMTNANIFYSSPLNSLSVSCQDNALGVVNTYCTIIFGTQNPLLASGNIKIVFNGMTVATSTCTLTSSNGTNIPVTCSSTQDTKNVTAALTGFQFYPAGNFTLIVYGIGLTAGTISQDLTVYLYDSSLQYVIESGNRILTTTVASLQVIEVYQILYAYVSPLSTNTMSVSFYLPRMLYNDEDFGFVIGKDLSDVNTEILRLNIIITRQDGTVLSCLYSLDNVKFQIKFTFIDRTQLIASNYSLTIYGLQTPASQNNGAFSIIYIRRSDGAYTLTNPVNSPFPSFNTLITSNISQNSFYNTEGYSQEVQLTITNSLLNVDSKMVWIVNFPSYYLSSLFNHGSYCMINSAPITCLPDPNVPYQLVITNSPVQVNSGVSYLIRIIGLACPRAVYTNGVYSSRYMFVGVLQNTSSTVFDERALLLPEQSIQSSVGGIARVVDMQGVSTSNLFSFSSLYATFVISSNVAISTGSYLYLDLPSQFDNLNNAQLSTFVRVNSIGVSANSTIVNRRIQVPITVAITASTTFTIEFPNLPTPRAQCTVEMSQIILFITLANKKNIYAASQTSGNSAPTLNFVQHNLYLSFNYDQTVVITAGTYSNLIPITTNTNASFLSNIGVNVSSTGFLFDPPRLFLAIGQKQQTFRIGVDHSLLPVYYFYQAVKQEDIKTYYSITLNNNIQVTNIPVAISLPVSINLPKGGCSEPFLILLNNFPFRDLTISFNYDNTRYGASDLFPNHGTTKSQLNFNDTVNNNTFSYCSSSTLNATSIPFTFELSGTNFASYIFSPSRVVTLNIIAPQLTSNLTSLLQVVNSQRTFIDVNITNYVDSMIYFCVLLGSSQSALSLTSLQVYLKSNQNIIQSNADFLNHIYTTDRSQIIGQFFQNASQSKVRFANLLPQSSYTLCIYVQSKNSNTSNANCINMYTSAWGVVVKAKIQFTSVINASQLNTVLCFLTSASGTNPAYLIDQEGNSCNDKAVSNLNFAYNGMTFSYQTTGTMVYLVTNPNLIGDPSPLAFTNMFGTNGQLSATSLSLALAPFGITYLTGTFITTLDARTMTASPTNLTVYFDKPTYTSNVSILQVNNVQIVGGIGTVYFVLVLYKQISNNTNGTFVNIRLNYPPTAQQIMNCQSWNGQTADGCARAVYSSVSALTVTFSGVQSNSLYLLYYVATSQFPMRPVIAGSVKVQTVVTYSSQPFAVYLFSSLLLIGAFLF